MKLYWSPSFLAIADVRLSANTLEVNPLPMLDDRDSFWLIKQQLNGETFENNIGNNTTIALIVSADQMPLPFTIGPDTQDIEHWLYDWEDAKFRWIENVDFNSGDPIRVKMAAKPSRKRVSSENDLREFQYALVTSPFNLL